MHARRIAQTVALVQKTAARKEKLIDVGPHELTVQLRNQFDHVDSIGFDPEAITQQSRRSHEQHWNQDLNLRGWSPQHYDVVVACEVVEHLHSPIEWWMTELGNLLQTRGRLIITTPNGLALKSRVRPLLGMHPYGRFHPPLQGHDFGHYREYTKQEIIEAARNTGLTLIYFKARADLNYGTKLGACYNCICKLLPAQFKDYFAYVFQKL